MRIIIPTLITFLFLIQSNFMLSICTSNNTIPNVNLKKFDIMDKSTWNLSEESVQKETIEKSSNVDIFGNVLSGKTIDDIAHIENSKNKQDLLGLNDDNLKFLLSFFSVFSSLYIFLLLSDYNDRDYSTVQNNSTAASSFKLNILLATLMILAFGYSFDLSGNEISLYSLYLFLYAITAYIIYKIGFSELSGLLTFPLLFVLILALHFSHWIVIQPIAGILKIMDKKFEWSLLLNFLYPSAIFFILFSEANSNEIILFLLGYLFACVLCKRLGNETIQNLRK